jgi:protein MpaA
VLLRGLALAAATLGLTAAPQPQVARSWHLLGRSVEGRPIRALELRGTDAATRVLVVGYIHGNERAGLAAVALLERSHDPTLDLWIVATFNPDGGARDTRLDAHGVDLNRNFAAGWRPGPRDLEYPGPRPFSERESRIARNLIEQIRPQLTVWFHQPQSVVRAWGPSVRLARVYARAAHMSFRAIRWPNGSAPNWQNHRFPGCASFVVELPPGPLSAAGARVQAAAVLASSRAARC